MSTITEISKKLGIPEKELVLKGVISFIEKELRLAEGEIADLREKYDVPTKEALYKKIKAKNVESHPAWEDYITWKNKERYIDELKEYLRLLR
ncbi:MAG: hypothetical protein ACTSP1_06040 [Candidatus Freyarchaeota archaeon]